MYLDKKTAELLSIVDDYERRRIPFTNMMIQERLFVVLKSSTVEKYLLSHIDKLKVNNRHEKASTFEELYICLKKFDKGFSKDYSQTSIMSMFPASSKMKETPVVKLVVSWLIYVPCAHY